MRVRLFITVLLVPAIAFITVSLIRQDLEDEWQSLLREEYPSVSPARLSSITLQSTCADPELADEVGCGDIRRLSLLRTGAIVSGVLGLGMVICIWAGGRYGATNRERLLGLFRPGLYLTVIGLGILAILNGSLLVATAFFAEAALIGRVHFVLIGGVGLATVVGVLAMIDGLRSVFQPATVSIIGKPLERSQQPHLWQLVGDLCHQVGAALPNSIVVGLEDNFFVTEASVRCMGQQLHGRTLYLSLPLCQLLSIDELQAIIGHELGHFVGRDTEFSQKFYPIYRGALASLQNVTASIGSDIRSIALLPAVHVLNFFLESFALAERTIGRERELAADQAGVTVAGRTTFASALVKVHLYAGLWDTMLEGMRSAVNRGQRYDRAGTAFGKWAADLLNSRRLASRSLEEERLPHPTDSHPTLTERLRALGLSVQGVRDSLFVAEPLAVQLIDKHQDIDAELTALWQTLLYHMARAEESATDAHAAPAV